MKTSDPNRRIRRRTSRSAHPRPRRFNLECLERRDLLAAAPYISEVHPAGSGNGTYAADWFELTNPGPGPLDVTGWKMDDNSNAFGSAVALRGVTSIPAGHSAVFFEGNATGTTDGAITAAFSTAWFGTPTPPASVQIGAYGGSGVGLGAGGDAVNLFSAGGARATGITFGAANAAITFDNTAGLGSITLPLPTVAALSAAGVNGAFLSANGAETGSPDRTIIGVDLSTYIRVGRFDLPEPTRTPAPPNNLLAQEASAVTYDWDTDTLFVVGDGSTAIVQVSKTGQLIDSMTLAPGSSSQGTEFFDTEGLTYIGGGKFVVVEERDRQVNLFTYHAGTTLTRADVQTVDLGTFQNNIGIEGITFDPATGGFIAVKETQPQAIFQTGIDFAAGTATNGSPTTENSVNLFDPALAGLLDFADVFALSNLSTLNPFADSSHLLVLSQESGRIVNIDRSGNISSSLTIVSDPGNPLDVPAQQHEGLTMDGTGFLYVVSENGGGDFDHPQLWVYAPASVPNQAPTAVALTNQTNPISENTSTVTRVKVADVVVTDDGLGTNKFTVSGPDAAFFEVDSNGLYIKAGTTLDFEIKSSYSVTVAVDDTTVGGTPDATVDFTLNVGDVVNEDPGHSTLFISEVAAWSSSSAVGADWFEVTNNGNSAVNIVGWKVDDSSNSFSAGGFLTGITSIAPGESVIFIETSPTVDLAARSAAFRATWFGASAPATLQIGGYAATGIGLSTGGDEVHLFDNLGVRQAAVTFGASPTGLPPASPSLPTFNNAAALNDAEISTLSTIGVNGAFAAAGDANEIGSPGSVGRLFISEVAPWSSGNSPFAADWFEVTNTTAKAIDITGWRIDDASGSFAASVALNGITSIAPGESVIFIETDDLPTKAAAFLSVWFGTTPPVGLQIGNYFGGSTGLSTGGDAVNLYNGPGAPRASVTFGPSPTGLPPASPFFPTFDIAAALNNVTISQLSAAGVNGAFAAVGDPHEIGSPGTINNDPPVAGADAVTLSEDGSVTFNILTNDSDPNGDPVSIVGHTAVAHGTLVDNGNGSFTYAPAANDNGGDGFTYTVTDGKGRTATAAVGITVTAVNDAPTLTVPGSQTTAEDVAVSITGIAVADIDVNEGTGIVKVSLSVASGKLTVATGVSGGLTAAQVTSNGAGAVVLQGSITAINATLAAGLNYVGNLNVDGNDTLAIVASDLGNTGIGGALSDAKTVAINVLSPAEQIGQLRDLVAALAAKPTIDKGQAKSLLKNLEQAEKDLDKGKAKNALHDIEQFGEDLVQFIAKRVLTPAEGIPLLSDAYVLLQSLEIGGGF